ncbi:hypothetical protein [Vibrio cholerae]|uniref:hypothetical protein n=1 Tax=Vibrio cholerae TaxID=666 RepID=UPI0013B3998C|nr:hypothetical protein [Vibrio cholerae]MCX9535978.1 hypothetical protein [Vibrio cholerae]GIB05414.1 hypothetical protein VCSRO136_3852 [Vibrio cholerae]HBC3563878.1 hypothetical protein [Vibrio cholerae]HDZ3771296.1 hypothetical protein [Vibrio cholerae]
MFSMEPTLKGWYESYFSPTFEVMRSYIDGIEEQAELSIQKFEKGKETYVLDYHPEEVRAVTVFQGLDDETWDINEIFRDYFPNLQRKSALLTLTGMFEHELDQLCDSYAKEKDSTVKLNDIAGKGLERSTKYLEKVCGFDVYKTSPEWQKIKGIQELRNAIVHQNGKINDANGRKITSIQNHIEKVEFLNDDGKEVIVGKGYLMYVLKSYDDYIKLLDKSIKQSYEK